MFTWVGSIFPPPSIRWSSSNLIQNASSSTATLNSFIPPVALFIPLNNENKNLSNGTSRFSSPIAKVFKVLI